jgi:NTP pyrophosphatase (non-canonical NTP hydrolase)
MNAEIIDKLINFRVDRGWCKDHTPGELARALIVETAELNELFQWPLMPRKQDHIQQVKDELADIAIYLTYLTIEYGIDIEQAILEKIEKNAKKYPTK